MKIVVCIKQVPGTSQVEIDPETGVLKRDGAAAKINPYDLYALETAMRWPTYKIFHSQHLFFVNRHNILVIKLYLISHSTGFSYETNDQNNLKIFI